MIKVGDGSDGRIFEGIGAVSAGGVSRLFADYSPEVQEKILDYLFQPNCGAALQHLKVELGGEVTSLGTEPSHARTREEYEDASAHIDDPDYAPNIQRFNRGYEWKLLIGAKKRNPAIFLECLAWGVPGWIGGGDYFSKDCIDYFLCFISGAKTYRNIRFDYVGTWNEKWSAYTADRAFKERFIQWIKDFSKALAANNAAKGLNTKLVAADETFKWDFAEYAAADADLKNAVDAISAHYLSLCRDGLNVSKTAEGLQKSGSYLPLWSSEDGMLWNSYDATSPAGNTHWTRALDAAKRYNRNYIASKVTKTQEFYSVASIYDNTQAMRMGMLLANTPWSGYVEVLPTLWAAAHTTQFAMPGWVYVEAGCGMLTENSVAVGSYVTLRNPETNDYSVIIETAEATDQKILQLRPVNGFETDRLFVWRSDKYEQFVHEGSRDLVPVDGIFTVTLDPGCIYSLTTTTGQTKGAETMNGPAPFPFPYREDFDRYRIGSTPKYFSDWTGTFEVADGGANGGKCLRQLLTVKPIEWLWRRNERPLTLIGAPGWSDYEVSVDVLIEGSTGEAYLYGRFGDIDQWYSTWKSNTPYDTYYLKYQKYGDWSFHKIDNRLAPGNDTQLLSGAIHDNGPWHNLKLSFTGAEICISIDGGLTGRYTDVANPYLHGMCGLGSDWSNVRFDNFQVEKTSYEPGRSFVTQVAPNYDVQNGFSGDVGMKILTGNSPVTVKELGRYFVPRPQATHTLRIVKADDGIEVPGSSVAVNMDHSHVRADCLGFVKAKLPEPVILEANTCYYVVSSEEAGKDRFVGNDILPTLKTTKEATIVSGVKFDGTNWHEYKVEGTCYGPVNFYY